jgi:hypothetical protein
MVSLLAVCALLNLLIDTPGLLWQGSAVHPGCMHELKTELADSKPLAAAIDLEGCNGSNKYSAPYETEGSRLRWRDPDGGYFQYEYLGALSNGVQVVRIGESGGGSGFFQGLFFLRISQSTVLEDGRRRVRNALTLVGSESLGDRDQVTVELSGETVTIRRREFRGALGFGPEQKVVRRVQ